MKIINICLLVFIATVTLLSSDVLADQRSYVWNYEYLTLPRGEGELESYFTISAPDRNNLEGNTTVEHRIELEVGMTDRFDFGIYQIFSQAPGESLEYDRFQLRGRYRIGEKGRYLVDPLIYLEYKGMPDFAEHGIEAKLILAKDIGRLNLVFNPIVEFEFGDETEVETEYTCGMSYSIYELLRLGIEAKGSRDGHYIGPVLAHGTGHLWVALGSALNLGSVTEGKSEFQLRLLLGIGF